MAKRRQVQHKRLIAAMAKKARTIQEMKTKKTLGSRDFYQHNLLNMEGSPLDLELSDEVISGSKLIDPMLNNGSSGLPFDRKKSPFQSNAKLGSLSPKQHELFPFKTGGDTPKNKKLVER